MSKIILVTGGAGHIGSHIIEQLLQNNSKDKIISLDNYSNGSKENHISGAEYRKGHTKDIDKLIPETPDIVFHLGEYARIAPSFDILNKFSTLILSAPLRFSNFAKKEKLVN